MPKTDDTRTFNGKKYRFLCWVDNKSSVDWFKRRAILNDTLLRVTKGKSHIGGLDGYCIWTRPKGR